MYENEYFTSWLANLTCELAETIKQSWRQLDYLPSSFYKQADFYGLHPEPKR